jgi:SecD/SecF fusion protein
VTGAVPSGAPDRGERRATLWRALAALAVIAGALYFALSSPVRLGLDLRGGTQIVLETRDTGTTVADAESTDRVVEVLRKRVDALGVSEPTLARSGDTRIIVELPGVQDPREAAEVIGRTAQLTFHPVLGATAAGETPGAAPEGGRTLPDESGQPLTLGPPALTGDLVGSADVGSDPQSGGAWYVSLGFTGEGGASWQRLTAEAACASPGDPSRRVAIVLDDAVISSPQVDPSIGCGVGIGGGSTQITGSFSVEEAKDLAALIRGGSLPLEVEVVEQRTVGPTLGAAAIDASVTAALIGLALTALFITVVYRLVGLAASIALACYSLISYAVLVAIGATLTLPGLAGFVLAIGLAIDANVLVFERAREEYAVRGTPRAGDPSGLQAALRAGFDKAWTAIVDSNVTTLIAAGLLFYLASGPVKGFGVTLGIGVLASMVSALVIARVLTQWLVRRRWVARRPSWSGLTGNGRIRRWLETSGPDLMRRSRLWLGISLGLIVIALAGIAVRGLNLGVEFTGGRLLEFSTAARVDVDAAREALAAEGLPRAVVQTSQEADGLERITVRTDPIDNEQAQAVEGVLEELGGEVTKLRDELIGPTIGAELRTKALIALGIALLAQMAYLAVRFRWTFGAAAVLAMLHDVLIVVGVFAWLGRPVDGVFLAAMLTIVGLSVNDTVVVFDRVRELRRDRPADPFPDVANRAVLQTVPRTINTGLGAMAILAALVVLGGDSLADFALALLIGLVVGTLSSIFTATPLLLWFTRRWPDGGRPRPAARPGRPGSEAARARSSDERDRWASTDPYADIPPGR